MNPLFEYISYRKYLDGFYHYQKECGEKISYRSFASDAGVHFTNFLPTLISGTRKLTDKQLPGVISALRLTDEECRYFILLVHFDQSKNQIERTELFNEIAKFRSIKQVKKVEENRFAYYSNWIAVAIRELLNAVAFNPKEEDGYYKLGSMLRPRVSRKEARDAVMLLVKLGFVVQESNGTLKLTNQQISTGDEAPGFHIREYYRQMHLRATESMDLFSSDKRELSGISMNVSENAHRDIKESIQRFRREVELIVKNDSSIPEQLVQLNVQMFPLAEIPND